MSLEFQMALYEGRHMKGENGDRLRQLSGGGTSLRPGNREMREVPEGDRLLSLFCRADERHPFLIAVVVEGGLLLHDASAEENDGSIRTPCRCRARAHLIDPRRVQAVVEVRAGMPPKKRRADIRSVVPVPRG